MDLPQTTTRMTTLYIRRVLLALTLSIVLFGAHAVHAATLSLSPSNNTVNTGRTFVERVLVSSSNQAMNAVSGDISFPADTLQVVSVTKGGTIPLWVQDPSYSNSGGTISFSGVVPNPGYQGSGGTVLTIVFRAVSAGTATLRFSGASVLANDGQGTELLTSSPGAVVTIGGASPVTPPTTTPSATTPPSTAHSSVGPLSLVSSTHPDQSAWYNSTSIAISWKNPPGVTQVRAGYDTDANGRPTVLYPSPINSRAINGETNVTYFHVQVRDASGWGPISTYRFNIDTDPPSTPIIHFTRGVPPLITFSASDTLSGVRNYEVSVNDGVATELNASTTAYDLSKMPPGASTISVAALDAAGNRATSSAAVIILTGGGVPGWTSFIWRMLTYSSPVVLLFALLALLAYLGWFLWNRFSRLRNRASNRSEVTNRTKGGGGT